MAAAKMAKMKAAGVNFGEEKKNQQWRRRKLAICEEVCGGESGSEMK